MLLVIYLLLGFFIIFSQYGIILIGSCFFFVLSIRFVFLLEIKNAVIVGIIACVASGIGHYIFPEWLFRFYGIEDTVIFYKILIFLIFVLNILILFLNLRTTAKEEAIIKSAILEFGRKIARLKIKDISEKSNVDTSTVFRILNEMIKNQEIYAEYFKSSKTVAFNQIANLENIDSLMKLYEDWEHQKLKKV